MASDDVPSGNEPDRKHLLDEIRRRAEEAELRRIEEEEEERKRFQEEEPLLPPPVEQVKPGDEPLPMPPPLSKKALEEQKSNIVRERLLIALDRGKLEKAESLLEELAELTPDDPEVEMFRDRLEALQEEKRAAKERRRAPSEARPRAESARLKAEEEARKKKKIDEMLEQTNSLYQQEKYDPALKTLEEILALDPGRDDVVKLREQVQRAKVLAQQIREEDAKRKAEESAHLPPIPPLPETTGPKAGDGDFWGSSSRSPVHDELGYELPPEEKGPVGPPKPALGVRVAERVSRIKIPVKPIVTGLVLILIGLSAYVIIDHIRNAVSPPRYCLLVFPAAPIEGDSTVGYIAAGLADDLGRDFAQIEELRVVSPVTGSTLALLSRTPLQLARSVGANYYLQWSIAKAGDVVILRPALYDTLSPNSLYSTQHQVSFRELPAYSKELVRKIVATMQLRLTAEEETSLRAVPTSIAASYDAYLQGRMMLGLRDDYPVDGALHMFEVAVQADSGFADALSALGWAHILSYETESVPRQQHIAQAQQYAQRALVRDPRNAEACRVLGMVQEFRGDFGRAIELFEESTGIAPSDAESQRRLAVAFVARGEADDAIKTAQRAVTVDPGDVDSYTTLGLIQMLQSSYKDAVGSFEQALRLARDRTEFSGGLYADIFVYNQQPERSIEQLLDRVARYRQSYVDYYRLARVAQSAGRPKADWQNSLLRSKELIDARLQENPEDAFALTYLALVQTRMGEFRLASAALSRALKIAPNDVDVLLNTSRLYALQRDKKQALEYLTKYLHYRYNLRALADMDFYNLRSDEDFIKAITM